MAPGNREPTISVDESAELAFKDVRGRRFAILCCWLLGIGSLLSWNTLLTISDYYYRIFPANYHPSRVLTPMHQPCAVATMAYLTWNESNINTRKRNISGYLIYGLSSFSFIALDLVSRGKGTILYYVFLCLICGTFGIADGLVQGGMVDDLSFMDPVFLQSFFGGLAVSGVLTSGLRLMTKAVFEDQAQGLRHGALLFLSISAAIEVLCIAVYAFVFPKIPIIKHYRENAAAQGSSTVLADLAVVGVHQDDNHQVIDRLTTKQLILQNWDYALDLYIISALTLSIFPGCIYENTGTHALASWYPLVLVAIYNLCDLISRYTPLLSFLRIKSRKGLMGACIARLLFLPAFYFTAKYCDQGWMMLLVSLLGLTHGNLTVSVMMAYSHGYKGPEQNALGNALMVFLLAGICSGAALNWLWLIGNGKF